MHIWGVAMARGDSRPDHVSATVCEERFESYYTSFRGQDRPRVVN